MNKLIAGKLRGKAGETIAETLIALLISALALMMLAGAISSAGTAVRASKNKLTSYYAGDAQIAAHKGSGIPITLTIAGTSGTSVSQSYSLSAYENSIFSNAKVITY